MKQNTKFSAKREQNPENIKFPNEFMKGKTRLDKKLIRNSHKESLAEICLKALFDDSLFLQNIRFPQNLAEIRKFFHDSVSFSTLPLFV